MSGAGLALTEPPEIAAPGNEEACKEDDEDRRQTRGEGGPVDVDQTESVIRLVADSLDSLFSIWRDDSSDMLIAGAGVDEVACSARYSLTSISLWYSSTSDCP